ncbi:MAG: hypothetical protein LIO94_12390 [Clostridiales bacterium]|nr:hypothetical protein [Clostridiales bacterium]
MKMHMLWGILCVLIVLLITAIIYEVVLGNGTKETGSQRMEEIAREMETEEETETSLESETEQVSDVAGEDASDSDGTSELEDASDSDGTTDSDDTSAGDGAAEAGEEDVSGQETDQTNTVSYQDQSTLAGLGY